jgi:phosphatidylserine/phosphatidylglycerophosphate/cardiolipin synthase-like enzyme
VTVADWFLSRTERGNLATPLDRGPGTPAWTTGNLVVPLIHGEEYFGRLREVLEELKPGDRVFFTDWRGDADERLAPGGPELGDLLCALAHRGVVLRGLLWRSHSDRLSFSAAENQRLGTELNEAGAQALLDQRVRTFGSHHQKMFVVQHRDHPGDDVAFVGGIDLGHGRRDDAAHRGDPQQQPMDRRYGARAPWHDAALELHGPVVGEVLMTFAERWNDRHPLDRRTPYRALMQRKARMPRHTRPLPESLPAPPEAGPHAVQVLRTYGRKRPGYPFAPNGERSIARAHLKAFSRARSLIYLEDQYLWSQAVAQGVAVALLHNPELRFIAVVPRFPDSDGAVNGPPNRIGQIQALRLLRSVAGARVGVFDLENAEGTSIYVHAKICIVDDTWFSCGSANFNRRSWTNDSELSCAVLDPDLARQFRVRLWSEHLGLPRDDPALTEATRAPGSALDLWNDRAAALAGWHDAGRVGLRPTARVRRHEPAPLSRLQQWWAQPLYATVFDPDGRAPAMRARHQF